MKRTCAGCGNVRFIERRKGEETKCECGSTDWRIDRKCRRCLKPFLAVETRQVHCEPKCSKQVWRAKFREQHGIGYDALTRKVTGETLGEVPFECQWCGAPGVSVWPNTGRKDYCDQSCRQQAYRQRRKLRAAATASPSPCPAAAARPPSTPRTASGPPPTGSASPHDSRKLPRASSPPVGPRGPGPAS